MKLRRRQRHQVLAKQKRGDKSLEEFIAEYEAVMTVRRKEIFLSAIAARSLLQIPSDEFDDFVERCRDIEAKRIEGQPEGGGDRDNDSQRPAPRERQRQRDRERGVETLADDDGVDSGQEETANGDVADTNAVAYAGNEGQQGENDTQDVLADLLSGSS